MEDDKKKAQEALKELLDWLKNSRQLFSHQQNLVVRCSYLISETSQDAEERLYKVEEAYSRYIHALGNREHGGVAADNLVTAISKIVRHTRLPKVGDAVISKSDRHGRTEATVMRPDSNRTIMVVDDGIGNTFPAFVDEWEVVE